MYFPPSALQEKSNEAGLGVLNSHVGFIADILLPDPTLCVSLAALQASIRVCVYYFALLDTDARFGQNGDVLTYNLKMRDFRGEMVF